MTAFAVAARVVPVVEIRNTRMSAQSGGAYTSNTFRLLLGPDAAREVKASGLAEFVLSHPSPHWLDLYAVAACKNMSLDILDRLLKKIPPATFSRAPGYWSVYLALAHNKVTSPEALHELLTLPVEASTENKLIVDRYKEARDHVRRRLGIT